MARIDNELAAALDEIRRRQDWKRFERYRHLAPKGQPGTHQKQYDFHSSLASARLFVGANRSGKTMSGAMETLMWIMPKPDPLLHPAGDTRGKTWFGRPVPPGPLRIRVVGPELPGPLDKDHVQRDMFKELVPPFLWRGESFEKAYSAVGHTLWFRNGSHIEFMSYEQEIQKHAGAALNAVWFDEECPQYIFNESLARLDKAGGCWWMTYTPVIGLQWIYDAFYMPAKKQETRQVELFEADIEDNRYNLREGFIEETGALWSDDEQLVRLRGKYAAQRGLVFDVFGSDHVARNMEIVD